MKQPETTPNYAEAPFSLMVFPDSDKAAITYPKMASGSRALKPLVQALRFAATQSRMRCVCCHFNDASKQGMPTGFLKAFQKDGDRMNYEQDNILPVCPLCFDMLTVAYADNPRTGLYFNTPILKQIEITNIVRTIMIAIHRGGEMAEDARKQYNDLEQLLYNDSLLYAPDGFPHNADEFCAVMSTERVSRSLPDRKKYLRHLKYLPPLDGYEQAVIFWDRDVYNVSTKDDWDMSVNKALGLG